ncbi:DUF805 domain-containing protein [Aquiluna sp.]|nr:DUF805 domain-containing protein [Aquiluna sp.]
MTFVGAIKSGFKNYINFKGNASRREFWYWFLFTFLMALVLGTIQGAIWPAAETTGDFATDIQSFGNDFTPLTTISSLGLLLPNLSVLARRLHDGGYSAKWLFLWLAPLAYGIFSTIGATTLINDYPTGQEFSAELLMALIFLLLPIFALLAVVVVIFFVLVLKKSKSFYDGNKYVAPEPLDSLDEGTTA